MKIKKENKRKGRTKKNCNHVRHSDHWQFSLCYWDVVGRLISSYLFISSSSSASCRRPNANSLQFIHPTLSGKSRIQRELSVYIHLTCHVHCCSTVRHFLLCSFTYSQIFNRNHLLSSWQDKSFLFPSSFCLSWPGSHLGKTVGW